MFVLALNGSPRRGGNTEVLLDRAIAGARDTGAEIEKLTLNELDFSGCQDCGGCRKDGICIQRDELHPVYEKIKSADGLIFASPIFFGSLSAQSKKLIDRLQAFWVAKNLLNKKISVSRRRGIFICVQASPHEKFFKNAREIVRNFFVTAEFDYTGELWCPGADEKESVLQLRDCLEKAYRLGKELAEG
jgi:multimeric flavodoxin WrbA